MYSVNVLKRAAARVAHVGSVTAVFAIVLGYSTALIAEEPLRIAEENEKVCSVADGQAVIAVTVENIQTLEGNLRAQIYSSDPDEFLEKGKKLVRVDVPVETTDSSVVCVPLPSAGTFALVVMHDKNANGKADFFSEGFGFSNNPKLSLAPPDGEEVMFTVDEGLSHQTVNLTYIFGGDDEKKDKRRKLRRR